MIVPYTFRYCKKEFSPPILVGGKTIRRILKYPRICEYLDTHTGEIFNANDAKNLINPPIDFSLHVLQREYVLSKLSAEGRLFAAFVLSFRNGRGGMTPTAGVLAKAYSKLTNKDVSNVNRLKRQLMDRGVLISEQLFAPLFQLYNKSMSRGDHAKFEAHLTAKSLILT